MVVEAIVLWGILLSQNTRWQEGQGKGPLFLGSSLPWHLQYPQYPQWVSLPVCYLGIPQWQIANPKSWISPMFSVLTNFAFIFFLSSVKEEMRITSPPPFPWYVWYPWWLSFPVCYLGHLGGKQFASSPGVLNSHENSEYFPTLIILNFVKGVDNSLF